MTIVLTRQWTPNAMGGLNYAGMRVSRRPSGSAGNTFRGLGGGITINGNNNVVNIGGPGSVGMGGSNHGGIGAGRSGGGQNFMDYYHGLPINGRHMMFYGGPKHMYDRARLGHYDRGMGFGPDYLPPIGRGYHDDYYGYRDPYYGYDRGYGYQDDYYYRRGSGSSSNDPFSGSYEYEREYKTPWGSEKVKYKDRDDWLTTMRDVAYGARYGVDILKTGKKGLGEVGDIIGGIGDIFSSGTETTTA